MARWLVALAVGCTHDEPGSDGAPPADSGTAPCARGDLALALGTGVFAYEPLTDGEPVTINHGPDGGWHVWTAVDLANSGPDVSLHPVMTIPDLGEVQVVGHQPPGFASLSGYDPVACHGQHWADHAYIDTDHGSLDALCSAGLAAACTDNPQDLICALASHEGYLCQTATDLADGRSATDCRTVTLESDPIDASVCAGSSSR